MLPIIYAIYTTDHIKEVSHTNIYSNTFAHTHICIHIENISGFRNYGKLILNRDPMLTIFVSPSTMK